MNTNTITISVPKLLVGLLNQYYFSSPDAKYVYPHIQVDHERFAAGDAEAFLDANVFRPSDFEKHYVPDGPPIYIIEHFSVPDATLRLAPSPEWLKREKQRRDNEIISKVFSGPVEINTPPLKCSHHS
jgi:hypothetical protein